MIQELTKNDFPSLPAVCFHHGRATSSLDVAHVLARKGRLPVWGSVLVREQTAGRGQLRREWASPEGNLYAALRLPLEGVFGTPAAAPALGLLLAEALENLEIPIKVKWPNDILQAEPEDFPAAASSWRKVGGILLEERGGALVGGIGLNLKSAPGTGKMRGESAFPAGILRVYAKKDPQKANKAESLLTPVPEFWAQLAGALFSCYFLSHGGEKKSDWIRLAPRHLAFMGQWVRLREARPGIDVEGILAGIDSDGSLRLDMGGNGAGGTVDNFLSGSLVLR